MRRLIELCTLKNICINKITGWPNNIFDVYDVKYRMKRPIEIIGDNISVEESSKGYSETGKWINLSELIDNDSFSKYFSKYERLEPVIELYIEIIHSKNISNKRIFFNIAQALETYHSRFKTNNIDEFKERIDKVILRDRPKEWVEKDRKFLMAKSKSFITFESRLADLLLAEFQINFDTGDIKYYDFPQIIAQTRNYYIHYDEAIKDKSRILIEKELALYNRGLIYILEYYILIELGFSNIEKVNKKLRDRWARISDTISIIKYSDKKWNID